MQFEWDEEKRFINIRQHGIDFRDIPPVFDENVVIMEDDRFEYGEQRFILLGVLIGRVVVVVYTERGDKTRLISARKATKYEELTYFQQLTD